jgi:hypothetical protein
MEAYSEVMGNNGRTLSQEDVHKEIARVFNGWHVQGVQRDKTGFGGMLDEDRVRDELRKLGSNIIQANAGVRPRSPQLVQSSYVWQSAQYPFHSQFYTSMPPPGPAIRPFQPPITTPGAPFQSFRQHPTSHPPAPTPLVSYGRNASGPCTMPPGNNELDNMGRDALRKLCKSLELTQQGRGADDVRKRIKKNFPNRKHTT